MNIPNCPQCNVASPEVMRYRKGSVNSTVTLRCKSCNHVFTHKEKTNG